MPSPERAPSRKSKARNARRNAAGRNDAPFLQLVESLNRTRAPMKPAREAIIARTSNQALYDVALASRILVFALGPAGTGKTFLAATRAAEALRDRRIEKIIVTRPTIEAGEASLGFLPGELEEKNEPYFRPVRDALAATLGSGAVEMFIKNRDIEARPIQFVRGATLSNAFVLVDEAQNLTKAELKLLLTRIGENCTVVIDGDPDQCDIPEARSGLLDAVARLGDHKDAAVIRFTVDDVVRSGFVGDVIRAYARR